MRYTYFMREQSWESAFVTTSCLLLEKPDSRVEVNCAIARWLQDFGGQPSHPLLTSVVYLVQSCSFLCWPASRSLGRLRAKAGFSGGREGWRRGWDLNPRSLVRTTVFETVRIGHSRTSPCSCMLCGGNWLDTPQVLKKILQDGPTLL
jgi:hypothetical protein